MRADARLQVTMSETPKKDDLNPYLGLVFGSSEFGDRVNLSRYRPFSRQVEGQCFHIHWPEKLLYLPKAHRFAPAINLAYANLIRAIDRMKAKGGKLIWTAHNLKPHDIDNHRLAHVWHRWEPEIFSRIDAVVAMSPTVGTQVRRAIPKLSDADFRVIPHPHFSDYYGGLTNQSDLTRRSLNIPDDAFVISMLGLLRGYKNVEAFLDVFEAAKLVNTYLLVAGPCYEPSLQANIASKAAQNPQVIFMPAALSEADYMASVRLCDLMALNFSASLNSSSIYSALSLNTAVLAPDLGATRDVANQVGADWVDVFDPPLTPEALSAAIARHQSRTKDGSPDLSANAPGTVAQAHIDFYQHLIG